MAFKGKLAGQGSSEEQWWGGREGWVSEGGELVTEPSRMWSENQQWITMVAP